MLDSLDPHPGFSLDVAGPGIPVQPNLLFLSSDIAAIPSSALRRLQHCIIPRFWNDATQTEIVLPSSPDAAWLRTTCDTRGGGRGYSAVAGW
jgi:hypothetical protein